MERMNHSDWDAPIVAVSKKDGGFRISGDYNMMVNGALDCEQYCFPNFSELFATLAGGKTFTRLDIPYPLPDHSAMFVHLLVARNFLSLTYHRLISNFCSIRIIQVCYSLYSQRVIEI